MTKKAILLIAALTLTVGLASCKGPQGNAEEAVNDSTKLPNVSVASVETHEMVEKVVLPGIVHPDKEVTISAEVGGVVERIDPEKSDRVRKGEVLAEIDRKQSKAILDSAEAALSQVRLAEQEAALGVRAAETALENTKRQLEQTRLGLKQAEHIYGKTQIAYDNQKKRFERVKKLHLEQLASQSAYDDAESTVRSMEADYESAHSGVDQAKEAVSIAQGNIDSAGIQLESARLRIDTVKAEIKAQEANLTQAQINHEKGLITAPFDAYIDNIYREEGEFIAREAALLKLIKPDPAVVKLSLPEKDIPFIKSGRPADLTINSLPGRVFTGEISFVGLSSDHRTNTYPVEITVPNPGGEMKSGMIAQVTIIRRRVPSAVRVPNFSVIQKEDGEVVFVLKDGRAERRGVMTGILENGWIQITDGLHPGESLIIKGHRDLEDGEEVRVL